MTRWARRWPLLWLLLLAGCGGAVATANATQDATPAAAVAIRLEAPEQPVDFGQPFPLTVVRQHRRDLEPGPWSEPPLSPLLVQPTGSDERQIGDLVEHRDHYRAFAFATGEVVVPPITFAAVPRGGGAPLTATSAPLRLSVRSLLSADAGQPELPSALLELPGRPWRSVAIVIIAIAVLLSLWQLWRRNLSPRLTAVRQPPPQPAQLALQRLALLRAWPADSAAAVTAYYVEASLLLRQFLEQRFGVRALEMTSDELLGAATVADVLLQRQQPAMREVLSQCDLVKFAGLLPATAPRLAMLDRIASLVQGATVDAASAPAT